MHFCQWCKRVQIQNINRNFCAMLEIEVDLVGILFFGLNLIQLSCAARTGAFAQHWYCYPYSDISHVPFALKKDFQDPDVTHSKVPNTGNFVQFKQPW